MTRAMLIHASKRWPGVVTIHLLPYAIQMTNQAYNASCEVIVGSAPKCLPTSVPVLPILLRAILYSLQYLYLFPPIVCLFYLMQCLHPYLFLVSIQPGILFTYDYLNPPEYKTKYFIVNSIS